MYEIIDRLRSFSYQPKSTGCHSCQQNYELIVSQAVSWINRYFDGLCLDCMDKSFSLTGDEDSDYWSHANLKESDSVTGCRAGRHGQPTYWFSYMGQRARDGLYRSKAAKRYEGGSE